MLGRTLIDNISVMEKMSWDKLLSSKRVNDFGPCAVNHIPSVASNFDEPRSPFERDADQIIFSYPFRRLQDKTQVIPFPEYDFVHTRLTHSLEVAAIGRSFGKMVFKTIINNEGGKVEEFFEEQNINASDLGSLIAAACYAHDIGNPPFGHSGEDSISFYFQEEQKLLPDFIDGPKDVFNSEDFPDFDNLETSPMSSFGLSKEEYETSMKMWRDLSRFEGNANGFRILTKNCEKGINPTAALLGTFTKYPRESYIFKNPFKGSKEPKSFSKYGFFQTEKTLFKSIAEELGLIAVNGIGENDLGYCRHPLAFLMEASDDIAYGMIDFEDGCRLNLIDFDKKYTSLKIRDKKSNKQIEHVLDMSAREILCGIASEDQAFNKGKLATAKDFKDAISYLRSKVINVMIHKCFEVFEKNYEAIMAGQYGKSLIDDIDPELKEHWDKMKVLIRKFVYNYRPVLQIEASGFEVMQNLIDSLGIASGICYSCGESPTPKEMKYGSLLPDDYQIEDSGDQLTYTMRYERMMNILDYISGMTDNYAIVLYRKVKGFDLLHR